MRFALRSGALAIAVGACAACPAAALAAESWLQPETLSQPGTSNDRARIATNSPGVAAVIWTEFLGSRTPRFRVLVSTRKPDEKWTPAEQLSAGTADAFAGDVGVDSQGRITAVFDEGGKMKWATKAPDQPWTTAQEIAADGDGGNADLFVASDGTATAVWQRGNTSTLEIRTARRPLGGPWSSVETISPTFSYRPHIEGDIAGDVTVSYSHDVGTTRQFIAVDRPNSGPWGTPFPVATGLFADNVTDLVVAPNSGRTTVFWQNGDLSAPLAARTREPGASWSTAGAATPISGGTAGRLDLDELDRAAVDGQGLVTATWIAGRKVLTAYRNEATATWAAPTPPAEIDPGDTTTQLGSLQVASNMFGRAVATWTASTPENRWSLRGPGPGAPWSAPKPIDGVPADAGPLDIAIDDTGRVAYVWTASTALNVDSLSISTYGNPLNNPQPPAPPGNTPPTNPPPSGGGGGGGGGGSASARAALQGTPTRARGVTFILTMPAAGTATIAFDRSALPRRAKSAAAKFRRLGVVTVKLKQGRNVVRIKKVKKRKLPRGSYRATITPKVGSQALKKTTVRFKIKR